MKLIDVSSNKPSYWQLVFLQSRVNGATYNGEILPRRSWDWPKTTYTTAAVGTAQTSTTRYRLKIKLRALYLL